MSVYSNTVLGLFAGHLIGIVAGILTPGYALILLILRVGYKLVRNSRIPPGVVDCFPSQGLDAFAASTLIGMLFSASLATVLSHAGVNLGRFGFPIFGSCAVLSLAAIAILRRLDRARAASPAQHQILHKDPQSRAVRIAGAVIGILLITAFLVEMYAYFFGSPNIWDVPLLSDYQRAFWGDYPKVELRGGWLYPALIMVAGVFHPSRFPLLNSGAGCGWLCVVLLYTALAYLAPRERRVLWIGCASLFLIGCRFDDFLLTTKFSVLGLALFLLVLGFLKRYFEDGGVRYPYLACLALGIGIVSGLVAPFYAIFALTFLLFLFRMQMLPVIAGCGVWVVLIFIGSRIHWSVEIALIAVASVASAYVIDFTQRSRWAVKVVPPLDGALAVAPVAAAAAATFLVSYYLPYSGYPWYAEHKLLDLYLKGYGVFLIAPIAFLIAAGWKRVIKPGDAVLLAACFTSLIVPVAVMFGADRVPLPRTVPKIIFYEIGRDTSLYFVPVTICLTGAAILTRLCRSLFQRRLVLGVVVLALIVSILIVPSPMYSEQGLEGWEAVAFIPAAQAWKAISERARQAESIEAGLGPTDGFSPTIFNFGVNQIRISRALAQFGGPADRCIFALMRWDHPTGDNDAEGFFTWAVFHHLFPYATTVHSGAMIPNSPTCAGRRTVLIHISDYGLADGLPPTMKLRTNFANFRIYSERAPDNP